MKMLLDNQLPLRLAIHLRQRGHQCIHVADLGLDDATDIALWETAQRDDFIVVSKDEDFVFLANRPGDRGLLVWVRLGNCRNDALIEAFDRYIDEIAAAFKAGQTIVEIR